MAILSNCKIVVNLHHLLVNYSILTDFAKPATVAAVLKANAYGLGMMPVGKALAKAGCELFLVADLDEAITLRKAVRRAQIATLGGLTKTKENLYRKHKIIPVLNDASQLSAWQDFAKKKNIKASAIIQLETGLKRFGLTNASLKTLHDFAVEFPNIDVVCWMTHLVDPDNPDMQWTDRKCSEFISMMEHLPEAKRSFSNSAAFIRNSKYKFDVVRCGEGLVGINPFHDRSNPLKPVLGLYGRILNTGVLSKGEALGYEATYIAKQETRYAVVGIGYADGLHRTGSNRAKAYFGDRMVAIIGQIAMDAIAIDISDIPEEALNKTEWVELVGPNQSIEQLAKDCNTIPHEILSHLSHRAHVDYIY